MSGCCMARSSSLPKQGWLQRHSGDRPTPPPFPPLPTLTSRHICWSLINVPVRRGRPGVAWSWRKGIPHCTAARAGQQQSTRRGNAPHAVGQAGWKGCCWGGGGWGDHVFVEGITALLWVTSEPTWAPWREGCWEGNLLWFYISSLARFAPLPFSRLFGFNQPDILLMVWHLMEIKGKLMCSF